MYNKNSFHINFWLLALKFMLHLIKNNRIVKFQNITYKYSLEFIHLSCQFLFKFNLSLIKKRKGAAWCLPLSKKKISMPKLNIGASELFLKNKNFYTQKIFNYHALNFFCLSKRLRGYFNFLIVHRINNSVVLYKKGWVVPYGYFAIFKVFI
jgi:hypothetical protein